MDLQMLTTCEYFSPSKDDPVRFYRAPLLGTLYRRRVLRCIGMLPQGDSVLEIGYGSGVSFLSLAERFHTIFGVDLHDHGAEVARTFSSEPIDLHLRQGSILNLPYADESVDAAVAISIHEHLAVAQQEQAFSEVHRVLRPGGCYVVGVPGVNAMMSLAFRLLGVDIRAHHLSREKDVVSAMRRWFRVDVEQYSPLFLPGPFTMYAYVRGWKERDA